MNDETKLAALLHELTANPPTPSTTVTDDLRAGRRLLRRRRRVTWAGSVAGVSAVAVLAATAPWGLPAATDGSAPADPPPAEGELTGPWYAEGVLHLGDQQVEVENVFWLAYTTDSAVYTDVTGPRGDPGDVHLVTPDGQDRVIGHDAYFVATDQQGSWVAWISTTDDPERYRAIAYDTSTHTTLGETVIEADPSSNRPFGPSAQSIDDGSVYLATAERDLRWTPGSEPEPIDDAGSKYGVLDVRGGTMAYLTDGMPGNFKVWFEEDGEQVGSFERTEFAPYALLSPSGEHLIGSLNWRVLVVQTHSGDPADAVELDLPAADLGTAWDASGNVVVELRAPGVGQKALVDIYSCDPDTGSCSLAVADAGSAEDVWLPDSSGYPV